MIQLLRLLAASRDVRRLIRRNGIDVVFTTGGYIAAPAILGARWSGVPVVLHESDAIPGRVTRLLGRACARWPSVCQPPPRRIPNCEAIVTGTPVRERFLQSQALPDWVPQGPGPLLVVMGGSQGALGLNRMVRPLLPAERRLPGGASHRQQRSPCEQHRTSQARRTTLQR